MSDMSQETPKRHPFQRLRDFMLSLPADLIPSERVVAIALFSHAHEDGGGIYPGIKALCALTGQPKATLNRNLRALRDRGICAADGYQMHKNSRPTRRRRLELDTLQSPPTGPRATLPPEPFVAPPPAQPEPPAAAGQSPTSETLQSLTGETLRSPTSETQRRERKIKERSPSLRSGVQGGQTPVGAPPPQPPALRPPRRTRRTELPEGWHPGPDGIAFALERGVEPEELLERFRTWGRGEARRKADWDATWQGWCLEEVRRRNRPWTAPKPSKLAGYPGLAACWMPGPPMQPYDFDGVATEVTP
ncbi:helix-turn-helix domain-containing protein [Paracraurococcus lichenis]|uniref:helix-turn-helix domain-containing protein n=1 Tax=Paracraurococcus lichenis TaxID=3064888 RepID=UPI00351D1E11